MPKSKSAIRDASDGAQDPIDALRGLADALCRTAQECCRQHDMLARLVSREDAQIDEPAMNASCAACDDALRELTERYERDAAHLRPRKDEAWWHAANGLWLASREYLRHHEGCDAMSRRLSAQHDAARFGTMQVEYELEASSLLALRHAADAYRKARPDAN